MKKIFTITSVVAVGLLVTFACKKSSTNTPSTTTSTSSTTGATTAGTNTTTTSLTIDGTAASGITVSSGPNTVEYQVYASNPNTIYPEIETAYPGTSAPSGTYTIVPYSNSVAPTTGHCYLQYLAGFSSTYVASSGIITVTAGTPSNTAVFNNVVCTNSTGTHTLSGVFKF